MSFFKKNPNEVFYPDGEKPFYSVIKNDGPGELLAWKFLGEDFNIGSQLIVAESEEALFFKDGIIESVFDGGKYTLTTSNYPFISRLRNAFSGGESAFNCKVYFVNKVHKLELFWGTDSPIQMRDPVWNIQTSVQARGSYSIQVSDSKKFLIKLIGNNIQAFTQEELNVYFRSAFLQNIKANIANIIKESNEEILGICAKQDLIAERMKPNLEEILDEYGVRLVNFYISAIDIPENDPNRQKLEESLNLINVKAHGAMAYKKEMDILGNEWGRVQATEILHDIANNPGAGASAGMGMGVGMGIGAGQVMGTMASELFKPLAQQSDVQPVQQQQPQQGSSGFVQKSAQNANVVICPNCSAQNAQGARFCNECGTKLTVAKVYCSNCGAEMPATAKFCNECGVKRA